MAIKEVFPNPTVKKVIFQIRFPNLFSMENMIGDYQLRIMEKFPNSKLIFSRNILIAQMGPEAKIEEPPEGLDSAATMKIWNFISEEGVELNVHNDSLDITSTLHKTYNNPTEKNRFRDSIKFTLDNFFKVTSIPKLKRIGLRYIDDCPVPAKESESFKEYYNSTFELDRFPIESAVEMSFTARVKRNDYFLRFKEALKDTDGNLKFVLDFDSYAIDVQSKDYLTVTDNLHQIITDEYETIIKEPVYDYMRKAKG